MSEVTLAQQNEGQTANRAAFNAVLNFPFPRGSAHNRMTNGHMEAHRRKQQQLKSARVRSCYHTACSAVICRRKLRYRTAARRDTGGTRAEITAQCHPLHKHPGAVTCCKKTPKQSPSPLQTGIGRSCRRATRVHRSLRLQRSV